MHASIIIIVFGGILLFCICILILCGILCLTHLHLMFWGIFHVFWWSHFIKFCYIIFACLAAKQSCIHFFISVSYTHLDVYKRQIISRGCFPDVLRDCSLWWHGPSCLSQSSESNPFPSFVPATPSSSEVTAEEKTTHNRSLMSTLAVDLSLDFSSLHRLTRVYAYCVCLLYTSRCV